MAEVAPVIAVPFRNQAYVAPIVVDAAVKVTDPPAQNVGDPELVIVGVAGIAFIVTVVTAEYAVEQPFALAITV